MAGTGRNVSSAELSIIVGKSRPTIQAMIEAGCPVVSRPTVKGQSFELNTAAVIKWMIDTEAEEAAERVVKANEKVMKTVFAPDGGETKDQAETRRARANANIAEIKEAEEAGSTVPRAVALGVIRDEYAAVRAKFANFGNVIASRTAPITDPAKVQAVADELVRENLGSLVGNLPDA